MRGICGCCAGVCKAELAAIKWLKEEYSYYGVLQPFSDALKLILKETIIPSHSNKVLFYLAPISTLVFSLLG